VPGKIKHFTDLRVWRMAHQLFLLLLEEAGDRSQGSSAHLVWDQLLRSTASICANIAEGFNRSQRRFVNSLDIALGEANEAENWLYKARDAGFISKDTAKERLGTVIDVEKMLASLKASLAQRDDRSRESEAEYEVWEGESPSGRAATELPPSV